MQRCLFGGEPETIGLDCVTFLFLLKFLFLKVMVLKVVAINGSARKDGNTAILIRRVLSVLESEGIETELIQLAGQQIHGCTACGTCQKIQNRQCKIVNDNVNNYVEKMSSADGIILGSPTYFSMMTSEMKALIDRAGFVGRSNP